MMKNLFLLIALFLGLSILPSIIDGFHFPHLPDNGTSVDPVWPGHQPHNFRRLNSSEIAFRRRQRIIARKKFARELQEMTIPFIDTLDGLPKFLRALGVDTNSKQIANKTGLIATFKRKQDKPRLYARILRALAQHAWNGAWESLNSTNSR